jgi:hypothetical protein
MSSIIYRDTDKTPVANADFVTLKNYQHSFFNRTLTSMRREALVPGSMKNIRDAISSENVNKYLAMQNKNAIGETMRNDAVAFDNDGFVKVNYWQPETRRSDVDIWNSAPVNNDTEYVKVFK